MRFPKPLVPGVFNERPNRFLGVVDVRGNSTLCFIPNPGRMSELLYPGSDVYLLEKNYFSRRRHRKTGYDLVLVDLDGTLVSIDSRAPNTLVAEAIDENSLPMFYGMEIRKKEPLFKDSRLDFHLQGDSGSLLLEVKSCTLVEDRTGLFPDAPTKRGRRHLRTLMKALKLGRSAIMFVIQRIDADTLRPNEVTDPQFAEVLREAAGLGVEVYAYSCEVTLRSVSIFRQVDIRL